MSKTFKAKDRYGAETEFCIADTGILESNEADLNYKIAFSKALTAGILTRDRMIEEMRINNIWNDELQTELENLSKEIALLEFKFNREKTAELADKLVKSRERLWTLIGIQQGPLINSCEGMAELIRQDALMAARVRIKANNQRYWKNYSEFIKERDSEVESDVINKLMMLQTEEMNEKRNKILLDCVERKWMQENVRNNPQETDLNDQSISA